MPKCSECAFLGVRHSVSQEIISPDERYRINGQIPDLGDQKDSKPAYLQIPLCFVQEAKFHLEAECGLGPNQERIKSALCKDRQCQKFTPAVYGFGPKEHFDMIEEAKRLEWQASREDADKKHIENLRQQDLDAQHKRHWQNIAFGLLSAAISALAGLAGTFLARSN